MTINYRGLLYYIINDGFPYRGKAKTCKHYIGGFYDNIIVMNIEDVK